MRAGAKNTLSRTLPRVRELKQSNMELEKLIAEVAPFPGCVN